MMAIEPELVAAALAAAGAGAGFAARAVVRRRARRLADWMRRVRTGAVPASGAAPARGLLRPVGEEAATLARALAAARETAEREAGLRQKADALWTPERLREHVRDRLDGRPFVVAANREPYRHVRRGRRLEWETPASGLVTGLEPLLRACGGTWIAHGDGEADRETADERGLLAVPPDSPQYRLRRLWLSEEEERGYYDGFANEGLWPLCHIAHMRPLFRASDWAQYRIVNDRFAQAAAEEIAGQRDPCVLVQDYHLALMPRLVKARRPDARVALFWHIPWPNPESFSICPWQRDLLDGLLGADVIGFHTQYHCNNFLDTVDRALECRIDRERFAVRRGGHVTVVRPFPISVALEDGREGEPSPRECRRAVAALSGIQPEWIAVGVDRLDYTKGILERFRGVERLLERRPEFRGRFTLFQIGAPSRTSLELYKGFFREVQAEAARVNERFGTAGAPPIVLLTKHHSHEQIRPYYRAADVCLVTSLHDGMNLVAKEFVSARDDERGALVLSRFTGAARELRDALLVNPYDGDELADAIGRALSMEPEEQERRMARLRRTLRERNVYRWAGELIEELAAVRLSGA